jgi:trimeric autotransporter adhesin
MEVLHGSRGTQRRRVMELDVALIVFTFRDKSLCPESAIVRSAIRLTFQVLACFLLFCLQSAAASWQSFGGVVGGCNGQINAFVERPDGSVVIAGYFNVCGDLAVENIAVYHPDSNSWTALGTGIGGGVNALAMYGDDLYAGGYFSEAGGVEARNVARWDGNAWHGLGTGAIAGVNGTVNAVAVAHGLVYIGGSFTRAGATGQSLIARWDGQDWVPFPSENSGASGAVYSLLVSGNDLYVGGKFSSLGLVPGANLLRWDGNAWYAVGGPGDRGSAPVNAMASYQGDLYVASNQENYWGAGTIHRWNGQEWQLTGFVPTFSFIYALAVVDGKLWAGGAFQLIDNQSARNLASWDGQGWEAAGIGPDSGVDNAVYALRAIGQQLYAGGVFSHPGGTPASNVARWNDGIWSALGGGTGLGADAYAFAMTTHGSELYVGGDFGRIGGIQANRIARWDGSRWHSLGEGPNNGLNSLVTALAFVGEDLYVGGYFTQAGGVNAQYIARWDGHDWHALPGGPDYVVHALAADGDKLFVAGDFLVAGGRTSNHIALWQGGQWNSLGSGSLESIGTSFRVLALAVSGNDLYVGGEFSRAGGQPASRIARWDGTTWHTLGSGSAQGVSGTVRALSVRGNDLYVGGAFGYAGGMLVRRLALWNGVEWSALGPTGGEPGLAPLQVFALQVTDSGLYVGGMFPSASGQPNQAVALWNGREWADLEGGIGPGPDAHVRALAKSAGEIFVGGSFGTVGGGQVSSHLARWVESPDRLFADGYEGSPGR